LGIFKALFAGACLGLSSLFALPATAQEYVWRLQTNLNPGDPGHVAVEQRFAKLVEEMSNGRMKFEVFSVGSLFPVADGLEAIGAGVAEMGMLTGGYFAGKVGPVASVESGMPGALRTPLESFDFFYKKGFIEIAREAYQPYNVFYLGPQVSPQWDIVSNKPLRTADDFNGLKIRAIGLEANWFESMGASPVFMAGSELYTALATGALEAARWASPSANKNISLHEVAKYYIEPSPMPAPNNFFAVNFDAWNGLPDDLKAIMREATMLSSLDYLTTGMKNDAKALTEMQAAGVEIVTIEPAEFAKMEAAARKLWMAYAEQGGIHERAVNLLSEYLTELGRGE
jgi:TRAP-type C4-dicarboxylate transport system substrate-binding protein